MNPNLKLAGAFFTRYHHRKLISKEVQRRDVNIKKARRKNSSEDYLDFENLELSEEGKSSEFHERSDVREASESSESRVHREGSSISKSRESRETSEDSDSRENSRSSESREDRDADYHVKDTSKQISSGNNRTRRRSKPYITHGFQVDEDYLEHLQEYKREKA